MSKETKALEDALAAKRNAVLSLTEKIADLQTKLEAASFERRPALREELIQVRAELSSAEVAAREAERPIARARELDERAARIARFRDVNARAAAAGLAAKAAVVVAVRATSAATKLAMSASSLASSLGGNDAGYTLSSDVFGTIHSRVFERFSYDAEIAHSDEVFWPTVSVSVDAPTPELITGGLIGHDEREAHRTADAELAERGK